MISHRTVSLASFTIAGKKTWIGGQDNSLFGRFWEECRAEGLFAQLEQMSGNQPGAQTGGLTLGVSLVTEDPSRREFYYMIAVEAPENGDFGGLEPVQVPASQWEVFECRGKVPESIVQAEMYAFMEWLPQSEYKHTNAPEMEVYLPGESGENYVCEFWLPVKKKA